MKGQIHRPSSRVGSLEVATKAKIMNGVAIKDRVYALWVLQRAITTRTCRCFAL